MKKASALFLTVAMLLSMFSFLNFTAIDAVADDWDEDYVDDEYIEEEELGDDYCSYGHDDLVIEWGDFWEDYFYYGDSYVYWECYECCEGGSSYVTVTQSGYTYTGKVTINDATYSDSYYDEEEVEDYEEEEYYEEYYCEYGHDALDIEWDEFWEDYFDGGRTYVYWECYECCDEGSAYVTVTNSGYTYTGKVTINGATYSDSYYYEEEDYEEEDYEEYYCDYGHDDLYIEWDEFWDSYFDGGSNYVYWECDECYEDGSAYVTVTQSGYTFTGKVTLNSKTYTDTYYYEACSYGHDDLDIEWDDFWYDYFDYGAKYVYWECYECCDEGDAYVTVTVKTTKAATCTAVGSKTYTAKITLNSKEYTDTYIKTIAKKSHTYKTTTTKKATLAKNGSIVKKCSACSAKTTTAVYRPKTFTLSKTTYTCTGKAIKPTVTVKDSNGKKISSSYYTLSYKNNTKVGKATVTVKFKGNYSGTKTLTFNIKLGQVKITSYSISSAYKVSMKWKSVPGATKYEIYYYNNNSKTFKSQGKISKTSYSQTWKGWKQVKFKVRAVYMSGSKIVAYGPWSSVVTVKRK